MTRRWGVVRAVLLLVAIVTANAAISDSATATAFVHVVRDDHLLQVGSVTKLPSGARIDPGLNRTRSVKFGLALDVRNASQLAVLAAAISQPGNPRYHHFISPRYFAAHFGASAGTIARLRVELHRNGFDVSAVSANGLLLTAEGPSNRVDHLFHTHVMYYRLHGGAVGWTTSSAPKLDAAIGTSVASVLGLNSAAVSHSMLVASRRPATHTSGSVAVAKRVTRNGLGPQACTAAENAATNGGGWTDDDIAGAYGLSQLLNAGATGAGQTVAIYELEPFATSDIASFDQCYFGVDHSGQVQTVQLDGFNLSGSGYGEGDLDVENVSAFAPSAHIIVYEAPNTAFGSIDAYNEIISQDVANIVTTSWGECEAALNASVPGASTLENYLFEEAAAQGQTIVAAAGDTGSDDCAGTAFSSTKPVAPYDSVDDPSGQPYVLSVGGTSLQSVHLAPGSNDEVVWNDGADWGGGGGGVSTNWPSPPWQSASGIAGIATSGGRQVPDVSAAADEWHGITVFDAGSNGSGSQALPASPPPASQIGWTTIGGTSSAAPIWAAILADIASAGALYPGCATLPVTRGGADLGFVTPAIYAAAAANYSANFHDIALGNNDVFGLGRGYDAASGYDMASGLGSPVVVGPAGAPGLASQLCAEATAPVAPTISSLIPRTGPPIGGGEVEINLVQPIEQGATVYVEFGGIAATIVSVEGNQLVVLAPASPSIAGTPSVDGVGTVLIAVSVTTSSGTLTSGGSAVSLYDYVESSTNGTQAPQVSGIGESGGNRHGGNVVTVYGSGFASSTPTVTFGGLASHDVSVVSDNELEVVVPPQSPNTQCVIKGALGAGSCQVQVVVSNASGSSAKSKILPSVYGAVVWTPQGIVAGKAREEVSPAPTEYDYAPTPSITRVSTASIGLGRTRVTLHGHGFSLNTFEWVNFGSPTSPNSEQLQVRYISPTMLSIDAPGSFGGDRVTSAITVQTLGGLSNTINVARGH